MNSARVRGIAQCRAAVTPRSRYVLLNSPLTFPTQFRKSKLDGGLGRISFAPTHGFAGYATLNNRRLQHERNHGILSGSYNLTGAADCLPRCRQNRRSLGRLLPEWLERKHRLQLDGT